MPRDLGKRLRLLIVDDEEAILTALQLALQDDDWQLEVATTAELAYRKFAEAPFDLMLVDKNLPDADGVELVRRIRADYDTVRFVMITGYPSLESALAAANLGVDAYLEKPFRDVFAVAETVREVLARAEPIPGQRRLRSGDELRVLIASAEASTHEQLTRHIGSDETRVLQARSSERLIELLRDERPEVVIVHAALDVVELVERIRDADPSAAVIVVSESLDLEAVRRLMALEVSAIIDQPPDSSQSRDRLDRMLRATRTSLERGGEST